MYLAWRAEKKFEKATELYTQAIEICPTAILYSNRALAAIKQESYGLAIADAESAIGYVA
jgi:serine/threonine-protein phosphatase 5